FPRPIRRQVRIPAAAGSSSAAAADGRLTSNNRTTLEAVSTGCSWSEARTRAVTGSERGTATHPGGDRELRGVAGGPAETAVGPPALDVLARAGQQHRADRVERVRAQPAAHQDRVEQRASDPADETAGRPATAVSRIVLSDLQEFATARGLLLSSAPCHFRTS